MMKPVSINQSNRQMYHCRSVEARFKSFPTEHVEPLADLFRGARERVTPIPLLRGKSIDYLPNARNGQLATHGVGNIACFYPDSTQGMKWFTQPSGFDLGQQVADVVHPSPQFGLTQFNVTGRKLIPTKYFETDYVESEANAEEVMRCYNRAMESYHAIRTLLFVLGKAPPPTLLTQIKEYPKSTYSSPLCSLGKGSSNSAASAPASTTQIPSTHHVLKTCMVAAPENSTHKQYNSDANKNGVIKSSSQNMHQGKTLSLTRSDSRLCSNNHQVNLGLNENKRQHLINCCKKPDNHKNCIKTQSAATSGMSKFYYWTKPFDNEAESQKQNYQLSRQQKELENGKIKQEFILYAGAPTLLKNNTRVIPIKESTKLISRSLSEESLGFNTSDNKKSCNNDNHSTFNNSDDSTTMSSQKTKSFLKKANNNQVTNAPPLRHCVSAMVLSSSCSSFFPPSHSFYNSSSPSLLSSLSSDVLVPDKLSEAKQKNNKKQLLTTKQSSDHNLNSNSQIISSYVVFHPNKTCKQSSEASGPLIEHQKSDYKDNQHLSPTKQRVAASTAWSSTSSLTSTTSQVSGSPSIFTTTAATSSSFVSPLRMTHSDADLVAYEAAYYQGLQDNMETKSSNSNHILRHRLLLSNLKQSFWKKFFSNTHDLRQYFIYSHAQFREQSCAMVPLSNKLVSLWKPSQFDILRAMWIDTATITIQKHWRGFKGRQKAREELQYKLWLLYAAQKIRKLQKCVRTFLHKLQKEQSDILERIINKRKWAANRLQTAWMQWVHKRNEKQEQLVNIIRRVRNTAAIELQRVYRGYKTRYFTDIFATHWVLTWKWDPPGKVVEVVGSFTYPPWRKRILLMWNPLFRLYMVALPRISGNHEIKFIVDGQYCCDGGLPIVCDGAEHYNNVVYFEDNDNSERALRLLHSVRTRNVKLRKQESSSSCDSSTSLYSTLLSSSPSDSGSKTVSRHEDHEITDLVSHPRWSRPVRQKSQSLSPLMTPKTCSFPQNSKVSDKEVFQRHYRTHSNNGN